LPGAWRFIISPELRPVVSQRVIGTGRSTLPIYAAILGLIVLALSRPVIGHPDLPDYGNLMGRVLVLDMSGEVDVSEQRLIAERMVRGAPDILTGIVAFASEAFDVVPLTTDSQFLMRYLSVLDSGMMPETGRALNLGVTRAEQTLAQAGVAARQVVVISGGIATATAPVPSLSGTARYVVLAHGEPSGWSQVAKVLVAEITQKGDAERLADDLRARARRSLAAATDPRVFRLYPVCLILAAAFWLLLFRRGDSA
jgi:hypothetical protein